jgi:phenylacetate-CoA ligase
VQLREYQNERLLALVRHAYENVPYYGQVMRERRIHPDDIRSVADLPKLPVLTKEIVRQHASMLRARGLSDSELTQAHTGGSTGAPLHFLHDRETRAVQQAAFRRGLRWAGFNWGDPVISVSGGTLGTSRTAIRERLRRIVTRYHFVPAFELRPDTIADVAHRVRRIRPVAAIGYTSSLYVMARLLHEANERVQVPLVFTTAETLLPAHVNRIEQTLIARVFDYYGCGEVNSIAFQCERRDGYHVADEKVVIETLPLTPEGECDGENPGRAVITDLTNYAFPFIRYENGDAIVFDETTCSCGRGLSRLSRILGRVHDFIVTAAGDLLAGEFFPHLFGFSTSVKEYQIIQDGPGEVTVKLVVESDWGPDSERWLLLKLHEYLGASMAIRLDYVDEIPRTRAGKLRVTVSHLPLEEILRAGRVRTPAAIP